MIASFNANPYFKPSEFVCRCGRCTAPYVDDDFLARLTRARERAGIPFKITSGCRCKNHNSTAEGSNHSDHLCDYKGVATCGADISCRDDRSRMIIVRSLIENGIDRIGIYPTFIHAGLSGKNAHTVMWCHK